MSNAGSGDQLRAVVDRLEAEVAQLRGSRKRLAEAADADRRAIERALHDGVQQHLVALAVDLRRLAGLVDADPVGRASAAGRDDGQRAEAMAATTELAQSIYPPLLAARGFASALDPRPSALGVTVLVDVPAGAGYPPEITTAVYWSCVEALSFASARVPRQRSACSTRMAC